jgi:hypothetical protein
MSQAIMTWKTGTQEPVLSITKAATGAAKIDAVPFDV